MAKKLEWTTVQRKPNELVPLEINPRKITEAKRQKLIESLEKFNLAEIPAINKDNTVIAGNQRLKALQLMGRGDELIDVRVPNRKLTQKELKEYALIANTHAGEWDMDIFEEFFHDVELEEIDFDVEKYKFEQSENFLKELNTFKETNNLNPDELGEDFTLPEGDKAPFQQMTFTLADEQAEQIKNRITDIKQTEEYKYAETMGNENSNGNALYLIVMQWAEQRK